MCLILQRKPKNSNNDPMCTITQETIRKACERTIAKGCTESPRQTGGRGIDVSVVLDGREYSERISMERMREAYGRAWDKTLRG